jgi:nicotinamide-nucleotide amidase
MATRAGVIVTGTEVLTGVVADANGPWLSAQLTALGVDHAHTLVVGDRPADVAAGLAFLRDQGLGLIVTTGGLGPTEDDLTARVVAEFQGRPLGLDPDLEKRIWGILQDHLDRWPGVDVDALRAAERKQAMVPAGATILEPVGTAPGLVVPPAAGRDGPTVVVLPGPPRELQAMWPAAAATDAFRAATAGATTYRRRMLRLYGMPESEIAETLRVAEREGVDLSAMEVTTCLRRGEVEIDTRWEPAADDVYEAFEAVVRRRHPHTLFSTDGSTVDQQVAALLLERGWTIATAESCTAGLLAARLTDLAGSSAYVRGGLVVYADEAKTALARVPAELIAAHGAVSVEVAVALADGARAVVGADVGVGITGIAGPGGATPGKPVGTVCFCAAGPAGARLTRRAQLPGDRAAVRDRSTTIAMHLIRRLLRGESDAPDG